MELTHEEFAMKVFNAMFSGSLVAAAACAGCASPLGMAVPKVPESLRPPADQVLFAELRATGVQTYVCAAAKGGSGGFEWTFKAPEAVLVDRSGRAMGRHYAVLRGSRMTAAPL